MPAQWLPSSLPSPVTLTIRHRAGAQGAAAMPSPLGATCKMTQICVFSETQGVNPQLELWISTTSAAALS